MGPEQTLFDITGHYYKELRDRHGLSPFDLLSWEFLLDLEHQTYFAGRHNKYKRASQYKRIRKEIWEALERKAEALDMEDETGETTRQDFLDDLRQDRRTAVA